MEAKEIVHFSEAMEMTYIVKKDDGTYPRFKRSNIVESLKAVGVDHRTAKKLAKEVHELRNGQLKKTLLGGGFDPC